MFLLLTVILMWFTWIFFLAVMHLRIIRDTYGFTKWNIIPAYAVLIVGLVLDALLNLVMSIILIDIPREPLLTGKLKRLIKTNTGWKGDVAEFLCQQYLVPADKGHCG